MSHDIDKLLQDHGADLSSFEEEPEQPRIRSGTVATKMAIPLWMALRNAFPRTGLWPLIRGPEKPEFEEYPIPLQPYSVNEELFQAVLQERSERYGDICEGLDPSRPWEQIVQAVDASGMYTFSGRPLPPESFPTIEPQAAPRFHALGDSTGRKAPESIWFSIIETHDPTEIPMLTAFHGGEDCPPPNAQVEWLRRWRESHGAVPACLTSNYLECFVEHPPQNEQDSMRLAFEQWIFCKDIVSQGTQSIRNLAITLWKSPDWYFWWD